MILSNTNSQITTLTLNQPELHNAFDERLITELTEKLEKINQDPNIRVVILAANGKSFCAGADVHWMQKMANYSYEENLADAKKLAKLMYVLYSLQKPTIALVQGPAYGGGVGLVACCDIAIANPTANFCLSEVKIGLVPAVISPYVIKAIGERAARRYFLTAEKFTASEAQNLGLIHIIVPTEELQQKGDQLAKLLLNNSPQALTCAKQLIAEVTSRSLEQELIDITTKYIADIRISAEGQEGLKAFLEKREPQWQKIKKNPNF